MFHVVKSFECEEVSASETSVEDLTVESFAAPLDYYGKEQNKKGKFIYFYKEKSKKFCRKL